MSTIINDNDRGNQPIEMCVIMEIASLAFVSCYGRVDWALPDRRLVLHQIGRNSCMGTSERGDFLRMTPRGGARERGGHPGSSHCGIKNSQSISMIFSRFQNVTVKGGATPGSALDSITRQNMADQRFQSVFCNVFVLGLWLTKIALSQPYS
jgi:hypothetical protein